MRPHLYLTSATNCFRGGSTHKGPALGWARSSLWASATQTCRAGTVPAGGTAAGAGTGLLWPSRKPAKTCALATSRSRFGEESRVFCSWGVKLKTSAIRMINSTLSSLCFFLCRAIQLWPFYSGSLCYCSMWNPVKRVQQLFYRVQSGILLEVCLATEMVFRSKMGFWKLSVKLFQDAIGPKVFSLLHVWIFVL